MAGPAALGQADRDADTGRRSAGCSKRSARCCTEALDGRRHLVRRLYVNVNGESGYFDRSLAVYGREGQPCPRCGTPIRRDPFMNRSSYSCPRCQPRPVGRWSLVPRIGMLVSRSPLHVAVCA